MGRKVISLVTLLAFMVFSYSCYFTSYRNVETIKKSKPSKVKVFEVLKKNGEKIKFHKDNPGLISKDGISGLSLVKKEKKPIEINRLDVKEIKRKSDGKIISLITKDDRKMSPSFTKEQNDKIILYFDLVTEYKEVFIPFSSIETVLAKKYSGFASAILIVGIVCVCVMGLFGMALQKGLSDF